MLKMIVLELKFENEAARDEVAAYLTGFATTSTDSTAPNHVETVGDTIFFTAQPEVPEGGEVAPETLPEAAGVGTVGTQEDTSVPTEVPAETVTSSDPIPTVPTEVVPTAETSPDVTDVPPADLNLGVGKDVVNDDSDALSELEKAEGELKDVEDKLKS